MLIGSFLNKLRFFPLTNWTKNNQSPSYYKKQFQDFLKIDVLYILAGTTISVVWGKELKMWVITETGCYPLFCPHASCLPCFLQIDFYQGDSASLLDDLTQVGCIGQPSRCVHVVWLDLVPPKTQIIGQSKLSQAHPFLRNLWKMEWSWMHPWMNAVNIGEQPRPQRQQKPHIFAYLTMENSIFARFVFVTGWCFPLLQKVNRFGFDNIHSG